jgi:hypothetical protein
LLSMHCCIYIYRLDELRHSAIATSIVVIGWIQKMNACAHLVNCPNKIYMPSWECQNADCVVRWSLLQVELHGIQSNIRYWH